MLLWRVFEIVVSPASDGFKAELEIWSLWCTNDPPPPLIFLNRMVREPREAWSYQAILKKGLFYWFITKVARQSRNKNAPKQLMFVRRVCVYVQTDEVIWTLRNSLVFVQWVVSVPWSLPDWIPSPESCRQYQQKQPNTQRLSKGRKWKNPWSLLLRSHLTRAQRQRMMSTSMFSTKGHIKTWLRNILSLATEPNLRSILTNLIKFASPASL